MSSSKIVRNKAFFFLFSVCVCLRAWECNDIKKKKNCNASPIFDAHMHRFCKFKHRSIPGPLNLRQSIGAVGRSEMQGKPTKMFNTQQTYQPLAAEYGLGHLPWKGAHIYRHKQAMGAYYRGTYCSLPTYEC